MAKRTRKKVYGVIRASTKKSCNVSCWRRSTIGRGCFAQAIAENSRTAFRAFIHTSASLDTIRTTKDRSQRKVIPRNRGLKLPDSEIISRKDGWLWLSTETGVHSAAVVSVLQMYLEARQCLLRVLSRLGRWGALFRRPSVV